MVQTLAALLSWIAMLAVISIAVMVSGVWRPRAPAAAAADLGRHPAHRLRSAAQVNAQAEVMAQARGQTTSRSLAQRQRQRG